ncbi:MAG TPA: methyltransferase domain-containing protein [Stenomitos sp.]
MTSTLSSQIQQFYDVSSGLWEQVWGEHMHHGFYGQDGKTKGDRKQAQVDLIEELLQWARVNTAHDILDVGCGIGGSSLYLAEKFCANVTGITLSPVQAHRAQVRAQEAGLTSQTCFQVADALQMPFADASFDLVWSLESGEHMPDKRKFLESCFRVLKPNGIFIMATWCHRVISPETPLTASEQKLLQKIYKVYHLPYVISLPEYAQIAEDLEFMEVKTADWSEAVAPFWDEVITSALNPSTLIKLLRTGGQTLQGALALTSMSGGYRQGLIRYGLLCGRKSGMLQ